MAARLQQLWVVGLLGVLALAVNARADDVDRLQGKWKVTYAAVGNKVANLQQLRKMSVSIEGDKFTLYEADGKRESVHFSLSPDTKPPEIDFREGKKKQTKAMYYGIYRFNQGKLNLCWGPAGETRPHHFATDGKNDRRLFILER
jgi:uncharacterized protein (TIGR03067 family)